MKRIFSGDASINGFNLALMTAGAMAFIAITSANSPVETCITAQCQAAEEKSKEKSKDNESAPELAHMQQDDVTRV